MTWLVAGSQRSMACGSDGEISVPPATYCGDFGGGVSVRSLLTSVALGPTKQVAESHLSHRMASPYARVTPPPFRKSTLSFLAYIVTGSLGGGGGSVKQAARAVTAPRISRVRIG